MLFLILCKGYDLRRLEEPAEYPVDQRSRTLQQEVQVLQDVESLVKVRLEFVRSLVESLDLDEHEPQLVRHQISVLVVPD